MLDFAVLSSRPDFAALDFDQLALSQYEEANYVAICAHESVHLRGEDFAGIRHQRARLLARGYDLAVIGHLLSRMAAHPVAFRSLLAMLDESDQAAAPPAPPALRLVADNRPPEGVLAQRLAKLMPWRWPAAAPVKTALPVSEVA